MHISKIPPGLGCLLYFFDAKGYIQCEKAQWNQPGPIYGVTVTSLASNRLIFSYFSHVDPQKVMHIRKIPQGLRSLLYFFVAEGYIQCRKAQWNQLGPIYGVTVTSPVSNKLILPILAM